MYEKKIHLSRPTNERRTMCGRTKGVEETDKPKKVTCLSCKGMYEENQEWFNSTLRKTRRAAKKAAATLVG